MKSLFLAVVLVLSIWTNAFAWLSMGPADDGSIDYILMESKRWIAVDIVQAWIKIDVRQSTNPRFKGIKEAKKLVQINCITKQKRTLDFSIIYNNNVTDTFDPTPTTWGNILPDTVAEGWYIKLCGRTSLY